ncbi:unnamed protein product, partial [Medioppia subpectinata]
GDQHWKHARDIISPLFTSGKLRSMMTHITGVTDRLVDTLTEYEKTGKEIDMRKYMGAFTMDNICRCAYGIELNSLENTDHPVLKNIKKLLDPPLTLGLITSAFFPALAKLFGCEPFSIEACNYFADLTKSIIDERKQHNKYVHDDKSKKHSEKSDEDLGYDTSAAVDEDPIDETIDYNNAFKTNKKSVGILTQEEIVGNSIMFFMAGYDTTSSALTHVLYYLSQHPDCQQRLYEELRDCDDMSPETVFHLKYLDAVITETLRLAPSFVRLFRTCVQDYKLGNTGITIPAETAVLISTYTIQRDPKYWPNPDQFQPDRFLKPTHNPYAYILFGRGPRLCLGERFAVNQMKLCLSRLVLKFEFTLVPGSSPLSKMLFFMKGDQHWKHARDIISPLFTSGKLRSMMTHITDVTDRLVDTLTEYEKTGNEIDMRKYMGAFTMDNICRCAYGIELNSLENTDHPVLKNIKKLLDPPLTLGLITSAFFPALAKLFGCEPFSIEACNYFADLTKSIIDERKQHNKYAHDDKSKKHSEKSDEDLGYDTSAAVDEDPIDETMDYNNEFKTSKKSVGILTQEEIVGNSIMFFMAGYDTTSSALTHVLYYLSQHPDCQQRLYEELRDCEDMSPETVFHLKYLDAVITETLRLAPSFVRLFRTCVQDYKLGNTGITIPADTAVLISTYTIQRDPKYWPNPDQFQPDRFLKPTHNPYAYILFGRGPRLCLGERFAVNQMKLCLSRLVLKFEFTLVPGFEIEYTKSDPTMSPKTLMCNFKSRN